MATKDRPSLNIRRRLGRGSKSTGMNAGHVSLQVLFLDGRPTIGALLSFQQTTRPASKARYLTSVLYKCKGCCSVGDEPLLELLICSLLGNDST